MKYRGRTARTVPFAENVLSIGTSLADDSNPSHLLHCLVSGRDFS